MSNAILPHPMAVFAVGSTLVYCCDLRPTEYMTPTNTMYRGDGPQPSTFHVVKYKIWHAYLCNIFGVFTAVWTRLEQHELVLVFMEYILLLHHRIMYPYV